MSTSGQSCARASFSSPRSNGSSSAMTAVGRLIRDLDDRLRAVAGGSKSDVPGLSIEAVKPLLNVAKVGSPTSCAESVAYEGDFDAQLARRDVRRDADCAAVA